MAGVNGLLQVNEPVQDKRKKLSRHRSMLSCRASLLSTISEPTPKNGHKLNQSGSKKTLNLSSPWNQASRSLNSSFNSSSSRASQMSDGSEKGDDYEFRLMRRRLSRRLTRGQRLIQISTIFLTREEIREKFRYAIRVVRLIVRLHLALKCYSRERDESSGQSLDQLNYYSMESSEFATEKLVFSKSYFSASNVSYMPAWACKVLVLPPEERSQSDIVHIASLIRRFFTKTFLEENLLYLCRHCTYTKYEKKRVLIRLGHRPLYCYLLFSGSVFVNLEEQDERSGKKYYRTKAVLKRGVVFGEIGVIHNVPRTATIISRENVECLLIPPDVCMRVFPEEIDRDYKLRLSYMRKSDLFTDWPEEALRQMCLVSRTTEYPFNEIIDKNTQDSEFIYMVVKGRVEVMNYIDLTSDSCQQKAPAHHAFLPPLPVPHPKSLPGSVKIEDRMVLSLDFLYPLQSCDLLSLIKAAKSAPLVLVSRGAEVVRLPKLRLQTIPPLKCWKVLLEKAKISPRYPGERILSRLCLEHREWSAYKKVVLWDTLDKASGRFHAMKPETSKTAVSQLVPMYHQKSQGDDEILNLEEYKTCIQSEAPLHDLVKHRHRGPCIQRWNHLNGTASKRTNRSMSTTC